MIATPIIKSTIQNELVKVNRADSLRNFIIETMNQYELDDIVFGLTQNGPAEIKTGYLAVTERWDTLDEAVRTVDSDDKLIRYTAEGYFTGRYCKTLSECKNDVVFDIKNLEYIY